MAARDTKEVVYVRKWLAEWESKMASDDAGKRLAAFNALESWAADIRSLLAVDGPSVLASVRPGIGIEVDQMSGNPSFTADLGNWSEPVGRLRRVLRRDCRFLAAVSSELATDRSLGSFLLRSINRGV